MPRNSPRPMRTQLTFTREDPVTGDELATLVAIVRYDPGSDNRITRDGPEVGDAESITCDSYRVTGQADQTNRCYWRSSTKIIRLDRLGTTDRGRHEANPDDS
jgi:hypothetical protein